MRKVAKKPDSPCAMSAAIDGTSALVSATLLNGSMLQTSSKYRDNYSRIEVL